MQQFTIPQFIDVEDKIIGPITARQFVILLFGMMLMAIFYKLFDFSLFLFSSFIVFVLTITFAFIKVNGRPFHLFLLNVIQTVKKPGLRVWNHKLQMAELNEEDDNLTVIRPVVPANKHYTASRLAELSLMVDTRGAYREEGGKSSDANIKSVNQF